MLKSGPSQKKNRKSGKELPEFLPMSKEFLAKLKGHTQGVEAWSHNLGKIMFEIKEIN